MITLALAYLTCLQTPAQTPATTQTGDSQAPKVSAASIVSKMFAYYASAKSMSGTIHMTQAAQNVSVSIDTDIAYEAPSKLFLKQVKNSKENPASWLVTSDGKVFTYDYPNPDRFAPRGPKGRLMEAVSPMTGVTETFRDIFRASLLSLGDTDLPVELSIAGEKELREIRDSIVSIQYDGKQKLNGEDVNVLSGLWRADPNLPATARYQLFVADDGQLKRYARSEVYGAKAPNGTSIPPQEIVTIWDVKLQKDATPDESLFTVVR